MARISLGNQGQVFDARLQSDGKLVFGGVGTTGAGEQAPALARLTTAGQPDEDFGFEGVALGPPPSGAACTRAAWRSRPTASCCSSTPIPSTRSR